MTVLCLGVALLVVGGILTFLMVCNTTYQAGGGSATFCETAFAPIGAPMAEGGFALLVIGFVLAVFGVEPHGGDLPWSRCARCGAGLARANRFCPYCGSPVVG